MVFIFLVSTAILPAIFLARKVENGALKTIVHLLLGALSFTLVGVAFDLWETTGTVIAAVDILRPYVQFYPTLILALAIAAVVFITHVERDGYAYIFAGTGFMVLLPDAYKYVFQYGRADLALLGGALWTIVFAAWAFVWKDVAMGPTTAGDRILTAFKAAFVTYPAYLLTAIVAAFGESPRIVDGGTLDAAANALPEIVGFVLGTAWLYFIVTIILVALVFVVHDLLLRLTGYRRTVRKKGIAYERVTSAVAAEKPRVNHFAGLIGEIDSFSRDMDRIDRIRAASTIGRFKSEYQTLAARYDDADKLDAERMIKQIELEFMRRY